MVLEFSALGIQGTKIWKRTEMQASSLESVGKIEPIKD
jgi:hypothetical protein